MLPGPLKLVLIISSITSIVSGQGLGQDVVPCDPSLQADTVPPLPSLPDQFVTNIEANIVQKNLTREYREYYDYPNNRGARESYNRSTGEWTITLFDFNAEEYRVIHENNTCGYGKLGNSTHFLYMANSSQTHLKTVKDLLQFGIGKGEVFVDGDKMIRGIPVNHWTSCFKHQSVNGTYTLDYYFTKGSGYMIDGDEIQVPVRAVLNGTGKQRYLNGTVSEEVHSYYHIYEFTDFKPGPIKHGHVFEVPVGVVCNQGSINSNKTAPVLSDHFSAGLETIVTMDGNESDHHTAQLYMDSASMVYRLDTERVMGPPGSAQTFGNRPLTYIRDFQNGLMYVLDRLEENCTVSKVPSTQPGPGPMGPGGPGQGPGGPGQGPVEAPPTEFVDFFRNISQYLYQGQKIWRGMDVETWGYVNTSTGETVEVIFHNTQAHPENTASDPVQNSHEPLGVYRYIPGTGTVAARTVFEHMYGFSNGHPDPDVFDVSACFSLGQHSTTLAVDISGVNARNIVRFYQKEFISEVRQTLASAAKVSVTRISSLKWEEVGSSGTTTTFVVTFLLLDNKLAGLDGTIFSGPSISDAIQNLQQAVNGVSDMTFDLTLATNTVVRFTVKGGSLWELYSDQGSSSSRSSVPSYSSGSMAGLGIGMLIVGALLGLIVAYVIYKRFNTEVPYEVTN